MLGIHVGYDWGRMLEFARVALFEGALHICFHEKEGNVVLVGFSVRLELI